MSSKNTEPVRLTLLTFENLPEPPTPDCEGGYSCICRACQADRDKRVARGIRPDRSSPFRKAA